MHIQLNMRNLSNTPGSPTYGFKIPLNYIRSVSSVDQGLSHLLATLAGGATATHTRSLRLVWPLRHAPDLHVRASYTYTGRQLSDGSYSAQAHIAVTDETWTPWIIAALGQSVRAEYFAGSTEDLVVITSP